MRLPRKVKLVEVGPRDGLQNEAVPVPAAVKIALIDRLSGTGLPMIEATAFVSPKWVPQMADNAEVMAGIRRKPGVSYPVLVPNRKGLDAALAAGAKEVVIFGAATESFSQRNTNCSIAEGLTRFAEVCEHALAHGLKVRGDISVCLGCPYEGEVAPSAVARVAREFDAMGCYEITIADTLGVGTPGKTRAVFEAVAAHIPVARLAGHFHDTYGQALVNIYAALELGVATFDSSVAGLGGCPYARGATGNVASEDVLYMLNGLGIETGVDFERLVSRRGIYLRCARAADPITKCARRGGAHCGRVSAETPIASPCIGVCVMDTESGYCRGCCRTLGEIASWPEYTDSEKQAVLAALKQREASIPWD